MINYLDTQNALQTRMINFTPQEYLFMLQVILGERMEVAYANVYDTAEFNRNVPSEDEEDYLSQFRAKAAILLGSQNCKQLEEELRELYRSDIQAQASSLNEYKFSGEDVQKLLASLLHDRTKDLSESSVRDILALIKTMYESGSLDSGDTFAKHFIVVPTKFNAMCPNCNHELSAVEGLDIRCEFCNQVFRWDEQRKRFFPQMVKL